MFSVSGLFTAAKWKLDATSPHPEAPDSPDTSGDHAIRKVWNSPAKTASPSRKSFTMSTCCCSPDLRSSKSKNKKKSKDTSRLHSPEGASVSDIESFHSDMSTKNGFTDKETLELSQAFSHFDKNHDGKISSDELASVIKILRFNISESEVEEMIRIVDKNENGFVDYDEYLSLMRRFSKNTPSRDVDEKTLEAFRVFDLDGNGFIDRQELQCVMKTLGENLSEDDVKEMFSEADLNGDGKIDYKEFSRLISHLS